MLNLKSPATTAILAAAVALGPLATDMYLPAMPAISQALNADPGQVQLTMSLYMLGFSLAQLVVGPLADRFGRKPVLLGGLSLFAVASLMCMLAGSIEVLLFGRFLQAASGAAGPVLGRAAVRDIRGPHEAARSLAWMGMAIGLAPAVAPIIGGVLLVYFGWGSVFFVLAAYAVLLTLIIGLALPEPLPRERRQPIQPRAILRNYRTLARHSAFVGYALANACSFSGMVAFLAGSSFVLIEFLGVGETQVGWYYGLVSLGYIAGNLVSALGSHRLGMSRLILLGSLLTAVSGILMVGLIWGEVYTVAAVIAPQVAFVAGVGIILPQAVGGAVAPFPNMAGAASALFGFVQMVASGIAAAAVAYFHDGTPLPMAAVIATLGVASLIAYLALVRSASRNTVIEVEDIPHDVF